MLEKLININVQTHYKNRGATEGNFLRKNKDRQAQQILEFGLGEAHLTGILMSRTSLAHRTEMSRI